MAQFRLISADSHVMEPANFSVEHVDKKFKRSNSASRR